MMNGLDWETAACERQNDWCFPAALACLRVGGQICQTITQDGTEGSTFEQMGTK